MVKKKKRKSGHKMEYSKCGMKGVNARTHPKHGK
jgi:hypothetical protein